MSGEDDMRAGSANLGGEELDEAGLVVPGVDEAKLGAPRERGLELVAVALDRERGVVRRENQADDEVGTPGDGRVGRVGDTGRPVLHPGQHRESELARERGPRALRDRVQGGGLLDTEPAVALD